jgi:hypothetical protein
VGRFRLHASALGVDAGVRRLAQERQHRLINSKYAEHVGLPYRAPFIDGRVGRAAYPPVILEGQAALSSLGLLSGPLLANPDMIVGIGKAESE